MKKLMIAAAIVCAAAFAQAATFDWGGDALSTIGTEYEGYSNVGSIYSIYVLDTAITDSSLITAYNSTTKDLTIDGANAELLDSHTLTEPEWTLGAFTQTYNKKAAADLNGKTFVIALYDATSDATKFSAELYTISGLSDAGEAKLFDMNGTGDASLIGLDAVGTTFHGDVVSVPEPTSGLLLLLGVAGLALRRRRA